MSDDTINWHTEAIKAFRTEMQGQVKKQPSDYTMEDLVKQPAREWIHLLPHDDDTPDMIRMQHVSGREVLLFWDDIYQDGER